MDAKQDWAEQTHEQKGNDTLDGYEKQCMSDF